MEYTIRQYGMAWLCIVVILMMSGPVLRGQQEPSDDLPSRYGGFLHLSLNLHRAGFHRLPGVPNCCREFTGGSGLGFAVGPLYDLPLTSQLFLDLRAGYAALGADLVEPEETPKTTVIVDGNIVQGRIEHQLEADLGAVIFEPALGYRPAPRLALRAGAGLGFLLRASYSQREELIRPEETGVFENGRRVRNEFEGDIPDAASMLAYAHIGLGYDFPLNKEKTMIATPEIAFTYGFSSIIPDSVWSVDALRLGVAVTWSSHPPGADVPVVAQGEVPPPVNEALPEPEPEPLRPSVLAVGLLEDESEAPTATLRVEEFISTNMRPLLNYVFFDENSAAIPDRYQALASGETGAFRVENLYGISTIPTYHHLLNIVGRRMIEHPEANITIVGCNDGLAEKQGEDQILSRRRAENVFAYLKDVWGIDSSRMTMESRGIPAKPSNMDDSDGVEENRRVELYSDTWEVLAPVITDDTLRVTNPPAIRFRPAAVGPAPITGWKLTATQGETLLKSIGEEGDLPEVIDWNLKEEQRTIPRADQPLVYTLEVRDSLGRTVATSPAALPVEQITVSKKRRERIADKYVDRYSLILFDFDRADFNEANERIGAFIRERLREGATVTITGYTDRIGEADYNERLSRRRADKTAEELKTSDAQISGLGESVELYDNKLPEGRFYSRTVTIIVETPVQE